MCVLQVHTNDDVSNMCLNSHALTLFRDYNYRHHHQADKKFHTQQSPNTINQATALLVQAAECRRV